MGKLEVTFRLELIYPFFIPWKIEDKPVKVYFKDSGSTVSIERPEWGPVRNDILVLRLERQCADEELEKGTPKPSLEMTVLKDSGRAFWQFFEAVREIEARDHRGAGYPVVLTDTIESNPLVRHGQVEWIYNGDSIQKHSFGGTATIQLRPDVWTETARRLEDGFSAPAYRSFALDAVYFGISGDPPRAIIMGCAAWETALREYLESVASKKDEAYRLAAKLKGIHRLYAFVKAARGGPLFYDTPGQDATLEKKLMEELPKLRNRLLHLGEKDLPEGKALELALNVLRAIDWLFQDTP